MRMQNYSLPLVAASFWLSIIHHVALHKEIRYVLIGTGADPRALMPSFGRFVTPLPICCYFADISAQKSQKTTTNSQSITSQTHVGCPKIAISASKTVKLRSPERPGSVLFFLLNYGLSQTLISKIVKDRSKVL